MILDDCTSALDTATERRVLESVRRRDHQAVLLITQQVRNVCWADRILILEDGMLLGLGRHRELLETCPVYREMWAAQMAGEEQDHEQ